MAGKMPCYCSVFVVSDVKEMTLKSIKYSVLGLTYILHMVDIAFQAIY